MRVSYETLRKITALDGTAVSKPIGNDEYEIDHKASALADLREIPKNFKNIFTANHFSDLNTKLRDSYVLRGIAQMFFVPLALLGEITDPVTQPLLAIKNLFAAGVHGSIAGVEALFATK